MKKQLALISMALIAMAGSALADVSLIFNDNGAGGGTATSGSYAPGGFITFDISLSFTGAPPSDLGGYSLYFQSLQGAVLQGGRFTITAFNRGASPFTDAQTNSFPQPMNFGVGGADNNFDLGAGLPGGAAAGLGAGTYFLGTITFQIAGAAPAGGYTLRNVFAPVGNPNAGHGSVATNLAGSQSFDIPNANYTVTVIPEPTTWSLLALGLGALGIGFVRRLRAA